MKRIFGWPVYTATFVIFCWVSIDLAYFFHKNKESWDSSAPLGTGVASGLALFALLSLSILAGVGAGRSADKEEHAVGLGWFIGILCFLAGNIVLILIALPGMGLLLYAQQHFPDAQRNISGDSFVTGSQLSKAWQIALTWGFVPFLGTVALDFALVVRIRRARALQRKLQVEKRLQEKLEPQRRRIACDELFAENIELYKKLKRLDQFERIEQTSFDDFQNMTTPLIESGVFCVDDVPVDELVRRAQHDLMVLLTLEAYQEKERKQEATLLENFIETNRDYLRGHYDCQLAELAIANLRSDEVPNNDAFEMAHCAEMKARSYVPDFLSEGDRPFFIVGDANDGDPFFWASRLREIFGEVSAFKHGNDGRIPARSFADSGIGGAYIDPSTLPADSFNIDEVARLITLFDRRDMIGIGNTICAYLNQYFRQRAIPATEGVDYLHLVELFLTRLYGLPDGQTMPRVYQDYVTLPEYRNTWAVGLYPQLAVYSLLFGATHISHLPKPMCGYEMFFSAVAGFQHCAIIQTAKQFRDAVHPGRELETEIAYLIEEIAKCDERIANVRDNKNLADFAKIKLTDDQTRQKAHYTDQIQVLRKKLLNPDNVASR